ncbi:MAG: S9 family peptidase [Pseudomonadota bacterium]
MRFLALGIISAFFWSGVAAAETQKPPIEAYGALPLISNAQISPDGTKVATIANFDDLQVFMVFDTSGAVVQQIRIPDIKPRYVDFYGNDRAIMNASVTTETSGFEGAYEYSASFVVPLDGGDPKRLLTNTKGLFPAQSGLGRIIGQGRRDNEVLMPAFTGDRYSAPTFDIYRVNLKTGRGKVQTPGLQTTIDWFVNAQGEPFAREDHDQARNYYSVRVKDGHDWVPIFEDRDADRPALGIVGVMPDMSGLVIIRDSSDGSGFEELATLRLDGSISDPLLSQPGKEIDNFVMDGNREVVGVQYSGMTPDYEFLDPALQASYDGIKAQLPNATIYLDSWSDDREHILYHVFEPSIGDVWLVRESSTGALRSIANNRQGLTPAQIGDVLSVEYKARDGLTISAVLTLPPGTDVGSQPELPMVALPHGGPRAYDRMDFDWMAQFFASRGYVVLQPNFRGSVGFGREFEYAGNGEWGQKMQDDVTDGVKAMADFGLIDLDQVCIVGASYGGYSALAGAVFTPELYKCVIAIAPVSDLNAMLVDVKRESRRGDWIVDYWERLMTDGDARTAKLKSISPIHFAENVQAPILLLHGDDDTVVPYDQSTSMKRALEREGKTVELVKLTGEDHWLSVADTRLQALREMDRFIAEHMPIAE